MISVTTQPPDSQPLLSFITASNDSVKLERLLLASLRDQQGSYEMCVVDTSNGDYPSAAAALNAGAAKALGKYFVFLHQDVRLMGNDWLREAERWLSSLPGFGVAGVVGVTGGDRRSSVCRRHGVYDRLDPSHFDGKPITSPRRVQTLDEVLLIVERSVFQAHPFDESLCSGWHLYGVEICLRLAIAGFSHYALPLNIYHESSGYVDRNYFATLDRIADVYRPRLKWLHTTCGSWRIKSPMLLIKLDYQLRRAGRTLKGWLLDLAILLQLRSPRA